jgi:alpha-tubulin suppressor-like RCC1 family protein
MRHHAPFLAILAAALLAVSACDDAGSCETDDDCFSGEYCYQGACAPVAGEDAGSDDASTDDAEGTQDTTDDSTSEDADTDPPSDTSSEDTEDDDGGQSGPEVVEIGAGGLHTCAILSSGEIMCWGNNTSGPLGHGDEDANEEHTPVFVAGITNATSLDNGHLHSCAIQNDDTLWCWGSNGSEQIAPGSPSAIYSPMSVGLVGVAEVAAGESHTCARLTDGDVDCWSNMSVVNGVPANLGTLSDLDAGYRHSCGVSGGEVYCWGRDFEDQLGDGSPVSGISNAVQVAAGREHSCALLESGQVKCWGQNDVGQLGNDSNQASASPVTVEGLSDVAQIAAGFNHNCALTNAGAVTCWGDDGESINTTVPDGIFGLNSGVTQITVGAYHACALTDGGQVVCWGLGDHGQLGDGRARSSQRPVSVDL